LLFYLIEWARGRPLSDRVQGWGSDRYQFGHRGDVARPDQRSGSTIKLRSIANLPHFAAGCLLPVGIKGLHETSAANCGLSALMIAEVHAESFTISDIRVNGLQRVSAGSVFGALPLNVGDQADDRRLVDSTRRCSRPGSSRTSS
jgi:outer membrane protein insertion porin family